MTNLIKDLVQNPNRYRKTGVALGGALVAIAGRHLGVDSSWYLDIVSLATAAGVYGIKNAP